MNLLTDKQLETITKFKQAGKQREVLDNNGIYYILRLDGTIVTTWHHVNHPCVKRTINDDMPNFAAVG
jgi:hypothetical protein